MVTPSDRQGAGVDEALLAEVFAAVAAEPLDDDAAARAALAAAGRVLAQALDAVAADYDRVAAQAAFAEQGDAIGRQADRIHECASLVRRLCGAAESAGGGEG